MAAVETSFDLKVSELLRVYATGWTVRVTEPALQQRLLQLQRLRMHLQQQMLEINLLKDDLKLHIFMSINVISEISGCGARYWDIRTKCSKGCKKKYINLPKGDNAEASNPLLPS